MADGGKFDADSCQRFYEKFYLAEIHAEVDVIQGAVRDTVESVLSELGGLGTDIEHFALVLDDCGEILKKEPTSEDLTKLVVEMTREIARTKARSQEVEGSLNHMASEIAELRVQVDRLSRDSRTDALTGVANRRAFDEALRRMTKEASDGDSSLCLVMVDIDHFKSFNDTHGHIIGDKVSRFFAQEMERCVKGRDLLARYGGEEFSVLLPNTPLDGAVMLAESIRAIIEAQRVRNDRGEDLEKVTISLGVANFARGEDESAFIKRADACLYASKQNGRNRVTSELDLTKH